MRIFKGIWLTIFYNISSDIFTSINLPGCDFLTTFIIVDDTQSRHEQPISMEMIMIELGKVSEETKGESNLFEQGTAPGDQ